MIEIEINEFNINEALKLEGLLNQVGLYFNISHHVENRSLIFNLFLKNGETFPLCYTYSYVDKKLTYTIDEYSLEAYVFEALETFYEIVETLNNEDPNNFKNIYSEYEAQIKQILYEENLENFKNDLFKISSLLKTDIYEGKFHLNLLISNLNKEDNINVKFTANYNTFTSYKLSYIQLVQNIQHKNQLLGLGRKKLEVPYSFSLFDEESKKVIDYVQSIYNSNENRYYSPLESRIYETKNMQNLILLFKNDVIYLDKIPYKVRLKELRPKIDIKDDYTLVSQKIEGYECLLDTDLYYSKETYTIDIVSNNKNYNKVYKLVSNSPVTSIERFKDSFKYTIYLNFEEFFEASQKIKRELKLNALDINAYFDFNVKNEITVNTKFFINDTEISVEKLKDDALLVYNRYLELLDKYGFKDDVLSDQGLIWQFLNSDLSLLKSICNIYLSDKIKEKKLVKFYPPFIKIKNTDSMLNVFLEESEYSDEELYEIFKAIKNKRKFILLKDNIINLENKESEEFALLAKELDLIQNNSFVENRILPPYFAFKVKDSALVDTKNEFVEALYNDFKNFKSFDNEVPKVKAELRPYQIDGFKWLSVVYKNQVGGVLADDMGLGKTLETIAFIESLNIQKPILIVAPTSLIFNWMNEFEKFSENEKIVPLYGDSTTRKENIKRIKNDQKITYITSYDSLRNDIDEYKEKDFNLVILDEAQFIKNTQAKKTQSVKKLNAAHRLVLTGTPIENSVLDLWSIFDFLMPGYLPTLEDFKRLSENNPEYLKVIKRSVAPFILRRVKQDVLKDLPNKYEVIVSCEMDEKQRKTYDAVKKIAADTLNTSDKKAIFSVLPYLMKLRQTCITPSLFDDNYKGESGKLNTLFNIVDEEIDNGNKVLIFSQFVEALNIIEKYLKKEDIKFFKITGQTSSKDRLRICETFNTNNRYKVCIISLKAGGTGLNLTGANVVIHLDPWWNYAVEEQASDRAHRIGQTRNVKVIKLICENSIEQRVIELQNIKKDIVKQVVSSDDSSITSLTKDDIKFILSN